LGYATKRTEEDVGIEAFNVSETKETLITTKPGEKGAR